MTSARANWIDSLSWQAEFCSRAGNVGRRDPEFDWAWFEGGANHRVRQAKSIVKRGLEAVGLRRSPRLSLEWLHEKAELLWETRARLGDELSRLLFDSSLIVRIVGYRSYYFPRIDFEDLAEVLGRKPFRKNDLPDAYLGVPLEVFSLSVGGPDGRQKVEVITTELQLSLLNSYRQYLVLMALTHTQ